MKQPLVILENDLATIKLDPDGGAVTNFQLKSNNVNPLSFAFTKEQMPDNNRSGAPYQGHFVCLGRWGEPSSGEVAAGLPNHGHFANMPWTVTGADSSVVHMQATSVLEGMHVERTVEMESNNAVYVVSEAVQNINPVGRLYNIVQHPTLAAPFLDETTVINCNAAEGFDQALYKSAVENNIRWPYAINDNGNSIDLSTPQQPYNAVFSFVVNSSDEYGWITAYSATHQLLLGYVWKRSDYPWIHLWQHYNESKLQYRGIEFGTAGIHQPFKEIVYTATTLFGEKTVDYIDAGEAITKRYSSFLHPTDSDFKGVDTVTIVDGFIVVRSGEAITRFKLPNQFT